eukprot:772006-Prymnesium_polylepis.2
MGRAVNRAGLLPRRRARALATRHRPKRRSEGCNASPRDRRRSDRGQQPRSIGAALRVKRDVAKVHLAPQRDARLTAPEDFARRRHGEHLAVARHGERDGGGLLKVEVGRCEQEIEREIDLSIRTAKANAEGVISNCSSLLQSDDESPKMSLSTQPPSAV